MARSRKELEDIIDRGEVVLLGHGRVAKTKEELPSALELAGLDPALRQVAIGDLEKQAEEINRRLAEAKAQGEPSPSQGTAPVDFQTALIESDEVTEAQAKALVKAGYTDKEKVLAASNDDLAKVKGFEKPEDIEALRKLLNG